MSDKCHPTKGHASCCAWHEDLTIVDNQFVSADMAYWTSRIADALDTLSAMPMGLDQVMYLALALETLVVAARTVRAVTPPVDGPPHLRVVT